MNYWIGQGFGILGTIAELLLPQFKKKWQMLIDGICVNLFHAMNLVFLNKVGSGIFLFAVAITQGVLNLVRTLRQQPSKKWEYPLFFCLYMILGFYGLFTAPGFVPAVNAKNLLELLPIIGSVFSMLFICTREERKARKFLLTCNLHWMLYYIANGSASVFGSLCSSVSCIIAIIRDKRNTEKQAI